jgi:erythronate-4-phosphate dehydrogenase
MCDFATPHIAGYALDGKANGTAMAVKAISSFFRLGLENWKPSSIPDPNSQVLELDASKLSDQEIFCKAILHTYEINKDSEFLNNHIETFEDQRGNYPVRREFHAYKLKIQNGSKELLHSLRLIGFELI